MCDIFNDASIKISFNAFAGERDVLTEKNFKKLMVLLGSYFYHPGQIDKELKTTYSQFIKKSLWKKTDNIKIIIELSLYKLSLKNYLETIEIWKEDCTSSIY